MNWTYDDYVKQPLELLDALSAMDEAETMHANAEKQKTTEPRTSP